MAEIHSTDSAWRERLERLLAACKKPLWQRHYQAGTLHRQGRLEAAEQAYREVAQSAAVASEDRHEQLAAALEQRRRQLRKRLRYGLSLVLLSIVLIPLGLWLGFGTQQQSLRLTLMEWLAQQQGIKLLLSLPQSADGSIGAPNSLEDLLAAMDVDDPFAEPRNSSNSADSSEGDAPPAFQCSVMPFSCAAHDVPDHPGEWRQSLGDLLITASSLNAASKDCAAMTELLEGFSRDHGWRTQEAWLKGWSEYETGRCYQRQEDNRAAEQHYRRALCADGQTHTAFLAYYGLANLAFAKHDRASAQGWLRCGREFADHYRNLYGANETVVSQLINLGVVAWEWLGDIETYFEHQHEAREIMRDLLDTAGTERRLQLLDSIATLDANLLEAYIVTGRTEDFGTTFRELMDNPTLTPSHRALFQGLLVIHRLRQRDFNGARDAMNLLVGRYQQLPEYLEEWSWEGFYRWLDEDNVAGMGEINEKIRQLANALDGEKTAAKLERLRDIQRWIGIHTG